jgi:hypothetical protein
LSLPKTRLSEAVGEMSYFEQLLSGHRRQTSYQEILLKSVPNSCSEIAVVKSSQSWYKRIKKFMCSSTRDIPWWRRSC